MRLLLIIAITLIMLTSCSSPLPSPAQQMREHIGIHERVITKVSAQLRQGTYMEEEIKMVPTFEGTLVLTDKSLRFFITNHDKVVKEHLLVPYQQIHDAKYEFFTLISSYVAIKTLDQGAFAFLMADEHIKGIFKTLGLGKGGYLNNDRKTRSTALLRENP